MNSPPVAPPATITTECKWPDIAAGNRNALVAKYRQTMVLSSSSSESPTWGPPKTIDENPLTSWFTTRGDTAAHGKRPWVKLCFPEDVTVRRVTVIGNREPSWAKGFTVLAGRMELLDAAGKVLRTVEDDARDALGDFDFPLLDPVAGVRSVRFTSLGDQGDQNTYQEIAIGEILIDGSGAAPALSAPGW